ncbi:E3 ubiquitin-protein ligase MARCHF2 isoform X1 [Rattus norvegicus]|uniref:E3 ubiquitin-protein ligase MARCHF2 isoform X1 n=1 Tax=Rattus norvegicus TaxID=10116 RepID=UPI001917945B|nr:E3 ubiquitin-protein ligase MARCHF2 isoform X1 [Rattus norvegicus]
MTTGDCCHLPGSLCDCSSSPAFSKVVEATGLGPPQYVAQVTSRDGRLLSTVIRALDTPSDCPFCRICHEGANGENLLSPCGCTGTLGAVHKSCLEKWLSSSNTSYCELCHTEFAVEKRPRPLTEWLKDPGPRTEKRTLCCDMVCFVFITPLAAISGWLCLRGAQDHLRLHSRLEAVGLIALTIALFTIYVLWTLRLEHFEVEACLYLPTHCRTAPAGLFPIPLPAVLGMEEDQSESPAEDPGSRWLRGPSPLLAGYWTFKKGGRGDPCVKAWLAGL